MKIGTIGSGFIVRTILDKVAVTEGIQCCAVYSRNYETGRKLADDYGVDKVYTDLDALCDDPELDFIYVASPNSLHYTHVRTALEHGKNVLCEKPFVPTAAEARELKIPVGAPVLVMDELSYDENDRPYTFNRFTFPANQIRLSFS